MTVHQLDLRPAETSAEPAVIPPTVILPTETDKPQAEASPDDFDWTDDEVVVLHEQRRTAIYWNPRGDLVIRQERDWHEDADPFMLISAANVQVFLDRVCDLAGVASMGRPK